MPKTKTVSKNTQQTELFTAKNEAETIEKTAADKKPAARKSTKTAAKAATKTAAKTKTQSAAKGVTKSGRGGYRPGAGRKKGSGDGLDQRLQVCLSTEMIDTYNQLGGAAWLRKILVDARPRVLEVARESASTPPMSDKAAVNPAPLGLSLVKPAEIVSGLKNTAMRGRTVDFNEMLVANTETTFIVQCMSNEMSRAGIADGDTLVVDRSVHPETGSIVMLRIGEDFSPRRLTMVGRFPEFSCESFEDEIPVFYPAYDEDWEIVGVITGVVRRLA